MKKGLVVLVVLIVLAVIVIIGGIGVYNSIQTKAEQVKNAESSIDVVLQRRADLIPNLVNTVKGYVQHEEGVIKNITDARAKLVNANTIEEKSQASNQLTDAVDALMVVVENYPDLKASANFISLSDELAGTENRIATARRDYNEAVKSYNVAIKKFPGVLFANYFGFTEATYLETDEASKVVPDVVF